MLEFLKRHHEHKSDRDLIEEATGLLHFLISKNSIMSTELDNLTAGVAANNSAIESAITLLANLKTALDAAIAKLPTDDGAALQALSDSLGTEDAKLAAAVAANTPVADAPPTDTTTTTV